MFPWATVGTFVQATAQNRCASTRARPSHNRTSAWSSWAEATGRWTTQQFCCGWQWCDSCVPVGYTVSLCTVELCVLFQSLCISSTGRCGAVTIAPSPQWLLPCEGNGSTEWFSFSSFLSFKQSHEFIVRLLLASTRHLVSVSLCPNASGPFSSLSLDGWSLIQFEFRPAERSSPGSNLSSGVSPSIPHRRRQSAETRSSSISSVC